jgi:MFS transporter, DHA1 family, inner membrane transport protein
VRLPPILLLTASVALVGSNSLSLGPIAVSVAASFPGRTAADVMIASALFGAGTAVSALTLAAVVDRVGLARSLVAALTVLTLAMLATALAPTLGWLRAAQTVAGLATGVALPATYGLAAETAPKGRGSAYLGKVLTGWTLSMVFGASAAAVLTDLAGWRAVYLVLATLGAATLAAQVAQGFLAAPLHRATALSPIAALKVPGIGPALMVVAAYMMAFYGLYAFLGTHLQADLGLPAWAAGLAPLVYGLGFGAAAWGDPMIDRMGARTVAPHVFGVLVLVYLALALASGSAVALIGLCLVWGAVNHLGLNLIVGRLSALDPARRGAVLGLNSGVTYIALFVGTALFGAGYEWAGFAFCCLLSALCILPAMVEARRLRRRTASGAPA